MMRALLLGGEQHRSNEQLELVCRPECDCMPTLSAGVVAPHHRINGSR